jgi:hypothetical protein
MAMPLVPMIVPELLTSPLASATMPDAPEIIPELVTLADV